MKYLLFIAGICFALTVNCTGYRAASDAFYEGEAMGYRGIIRVRVGMDGDSIAEITLLESSDDGAVGGAAIDELTDLVLACNTTELEAISGATNTSKGFLAAVENAIMGK